MAKNPVNGGGKGADNNETTPVATKGMKRSATPIVTQKGASTSKARCQNRGREKCGEQEGNEPEEVIDVEPEEDDVQVQPTEAATVVTMADTDLLDCPICLEPLCPPVYQCDNGHLGCELCCKGVRNKCPSCSLPIGFNRCRVIERVVESSLTSCVYMMHGCTEKVSYLTKLDHEKACKYAPIPCPHSECEFVATPKSLYEHFTKEHPLYSQSITLKTTKRINVVHSEAHYILEEKDEKLLFILSCVNDSFGSYVNVMNVSPTELDTKFIYVLTAACGDKSITLKSDMEITSDYFARPAKEKCRIIQNDFHVVKLGVKSLDLGLLIRKVIARKQSAK